MSYKYAVPVEERCGIHGNDAIHLRCVQNVGVSVEKIKEAQWLFKTVMLNEPKVSMIRSMLMQE